MAPWIVGAKRRNATRRRPVLRTKCRQTGEWSEDGDCVRLQYAEPDTGDWLSLGAFQRYRGMEVTVPVSLYGVNVRTVFER